MTNPVRSLNTTPITATTSDNRSSPDRLTSVFTSQSETNQTCSPSYTPPGTPPLAIANPSSLDSQSLQGRLVSVSPSSSRGYTDPGAIATSSTSTNKRNFVEKARHWMASLFDKQPKNLYHTRRLVQSA